MLPKELFVPLTKHTETQKNVMATRHGGAEVSLDVPTAKDRLADVVSLLDSLESELRREQQVTKDLRQELFERDRHNAELQSRLDVAVGYRRMCVTLEEKNQHLCEQLQARERQAASSKTPEAEPPTGEHTMKALSRTCPYPICPQLLISCSSLQYSCRKAGL